MSSLGRTALWKPPPAPKTATNVRCTGEPRRPGVSYDERCDHASFQRIQFRLHQQINLKSLQGEKPQMKQRPGP